MEGCTHTCRYTWKDVPIHVDIHGRMHRYMYMYMEGWTYICTCNGIPFYMYHYCLMYCIYNVMTYTCSLFYDVIN